MIGTTPEWTSMLDRPMRCPYCNSPRHPKAVDAHVGQGPYYNCGAVMHWVPAQDWHRVHVPLCPINPSPRLAQPTETC